MAAWDNVSLPSSPSAADFRSPLVDFSPLARLGDQFFKGRENTFADQQRQRQLELQKPITGNDPGTIVQDLMRRGGSEYAAQFLPFLQQQQAAQPSPLLGGGAPATAGGPASPQGAPSAAPMAQPVPQQPPAGAPPSEVPAGNTLTGIAIGHYGADKGPQVAANAAKVLKIDPDTVLTPEQQQRVTAAFAGASGRPVTPPVAAPSNAPLEYVLPFDPSTGQRFTDPIKAIAALRREGARLSASPYSKEQGKQLLDQAEDIQKAVTTTRREQANKDREFAEKQRLDAIKELQPVTIGVTKDGFDIKGVRDPKTGGFKIIDPTTGQFTGQTTPAPAAPAIGGASISSEEDGVIPANAKLVEGGAFDYVQGAPHIEKGMDVPEPQQVAGKSVRAIQTDAENYLQTGKLPPVRGGKSPVAVQQENYRRTVQNYAGSLAESRGLSPEQTAEMWRTAPGMLRFILGADGRSTVSLGTAISHLDTVEELAKAWAANDTQAINRVRAVISRQFGSSASTNLEAAAKIVGPEIIKALGVAGAGTEHDRTTAADQFSSVRSPEQLLGAVNTVQKLLGGQLEGRERQALNAGVSKERFKSLIGDRAYEILSHSDKGGTASLTGTTAPSAAPPQLGKPDKDGWITMPNGVRIREKQ